MGERKTKRLGELLAYQRKGITPSYAPSGANTIRVFNQKCNRDFVLNPSLARYNDISSKAVAPDLMLRKGDVVINSTGTGTLGRVAQYWDAEGQATIDSHMLLMRASDELDPLFFGYALKLYQEKLMNMGIGSSGQEELDKLALNKIAITYPVSKKEQHAIGQTLAAFDEKIVLNQGLIKELETQAQMVYDYWFMQFDFPNENGRPYRSSGGKMVWSAEMKREIPEGWNVASLGSYLDDTSTGDWGKDEPTGNYTQRVYCIRGADILNVDALPIRFILKKNSHKFLLPYDTVIEVSGGSPTQATGRSTFISEGTLSRYDSPLICTNFCQVLRQKDTAYARYFYQLWNKLYDAGIMFNYEGKTSGIKNLLVGAFCTIKWYFPPREIAVQFNDLIYPIIARLEHIKQEQKSLIAQRDFLLPRLMTGEITVAE